MNIESTLSVSEAVYDANLKGITLIKQKRYSKAINFFRKGLKAIQAASRQAMTCTTTIGNNGANDPTYTIGRLRGFLGVRVDECEPPEHDVLRIHSTAVHSQGTVTGDDSAFLLFDRALIISAENHSIP